MAQVIKYGQGAQTFNPPTVKNIQKSPIFDGFLSCIPGCPPPVNVTEHIIYNACGGETLNEVPELVCGGDIKFVTDCPYLTTKHINFHRIIGCVHIQCPQDAQAKIYSLTCAASPECCEGKEILSVTIKRKPSCENEAYESTYFYTAPCGCDATCLEKITFLFNKINADPSSIVEASISGGNLVLISKIEGLDFTVSGSGWSDIVEVLPNQSSYGSGNDLILAGFNSNCIVPNAQYKIYSITYWDFMDITQNGLPGGSYGNNPLGHNKGIVFKTAWVAFDDSCAAHEAELCAILNYEKPAADYHRKTNNCDCDTGNNPPVTTTTTTTTAEVITTTTTEEVTTTTTKPVTTTTTTEEVTTTTTEEVTTTTTEEVTTTTTEEVTTVP